MAYPIDLSTPSTTQDVSVSGTTARTGADFQKRKVLVQSTVDCRIKFGSPTVTAALTDMMIFSGIPYYLDAGSNLRLAVISTGTGTLSVTEMI